MNTKLFKQLMALATMTLGASHQAFAEFGAGSNTFATATAITSESDFSASTNLTAFSSENGEPGHGPGAEPGALKTAWWTWTATQTGYCTVDTMRSVTGVNAVSDTVLAVYAGNAVNNLALLAQNDDFKVGDLTGAGRLSSVSFYAVKNSVYRVAVDGYGPSDITASTFNVVLRLRLLPLKVLTRSAVFATGAGASEMGQVTVTTTAAGSLSGSLIVGAKAYPLAGVFGVDGNYFASFPRVAAVNTPPLLPITLQIDGAGNGRYNLAIGTNYASGNLPVKAVFSLQAPNTFAGLYPIIMHPAADAGGDGVLSITVSATGVASGTGFAMDGTAITFSSALYEGADSTTALIPAFKSLLAGKGAFLMNTQIDEKGSIDTISGNGIYLRPVPVPAAAFYPQGIATGIAINGSTYLKPAPLLRVLGFLDGTNGMGKLNVINSGAEIAANFSESLTLSTANKFNFVSLLRKPGLTLTTASGLVSGTITEPAGKARAIKGVLTQVNGLPLLRGYVVGAKRNLYFDVTP